MADQVLVVDGNFTPYVQKANAARKATKGIADDAGKIGGAFSGALIKVELLKQGLMKAIELSTRLRERDIGASTSYGQRVKSLTTSAGNLGISDPRSLMDIVKKRTGSGATLEGVSSFISSLADQNKEANIPLTGESALEAIRAYNQVGDPIAGENGSDLLRLMKQGHSSKSAINKLLKQRGGNANYAAYQEISLENQEGQATLSEQELRGRVGVEARRYNAANRLANAGRDSLADEINYMAVPDSVQQALDTSSGAYRKGADEYESAAAQIIRANTEAMRRSNSTPNGRTEAP